MTTLTTGSRPTETGIAGLHASTAQHLPFAPGTLVRTFLLERDAGNVLIYSNSRIGPGDFARFGEIERRYLGHWHEAMFAPPAEAGLQAPLFVHADDAAETRSRGVTVRATFSRRHMLGDDLEVIPIPGHTPGSAAYLWRGPEQRLLFTADSIYLDRGEWVAAVLGSSDPAAYADSVERLAELEFDALVPWAASAGDPPVSIAAPAEGRERLAAIADRLRRGERR